MTDNKEKYTKVNIANLPKNLKKYPCGKKNAEAVMMAKIQSRQMQNVSR